MQPLSGKTRNGLTKTKAAGKRNSRKGEWRGPSIPLFMSGGWKGSSQKPGAHFVRGWTALSWRGAAIAFLGVVAVYGFTEGGYADRSAKMATKKVSTLMTRVGFAVDRVTVEGQQRTKDAEIIHALGLDKDTSTLSFNTAAARKRLEKLPLVHRAQVMRLLPSQLHVVLEERVPYAVWQHNATLHLVDREGTVIDRIKNRDQFNLPLVVGEGAGEHARDLLDELAHWPQIASKVQAAIRVANRRWNLKLQNGLEIRLPETEMAQAIKKVSKLDKSHEILSGDAVFVDLRIAGRVTIRRGEGTARRKDSAFAAPSGKRRAPGRDT